MQEQTSRLNVLDEKDAKVVEFSDKKILDEINITQIGDQLNSLISEMEVPKLVLDFASVSHMSSSALGMLITLHKRVREKNGKMRLCNIGPSIYEIFVITRLNEIFQISESRSKALESLS